MKAGLTQVRKEDLDELNLRPLEMKLIWRMLGYTRRHARKRNWLFALVLTRSIQLPMLAWILGLVINGPIARHDSRGVIWGAVGFPGVRGSDAILFPFPPAAGAGDG